MRPRPRLADRDVARCVRAGAKAAPAWSTRRTRRTCRPQPAATQRRRGWSAAPPRTVAAGAMSFFHGRPYISPVASAVVLAAPAAQQGTAGRLQPPPRPPATMRTLFSAPARAHLYRSCEHCKYNGPRCRIQHFTHATEKEVLWRRFQNCAVRYITGHRHNMTDWWQTAQTSR